MSIQRVYTIFLRQFFLIQRSAHRLLGMFYWSTIELFVWGFLTIYLNQIGGSEFNFTTVVLGTVILWNFLMRIQQGIGVSFLEDIWSRNFFNLFASPLSINEYCLGLILISITSSFISIMVMVGLAWLLFAYNIFQFGFLLIPFVAVLFLFGLALGIFTVAIILRFGPSSEILAWSIPVLLPPFSGVFYPLSALPSWLQNVAHVFPPSYVFEGMRSVVLGGNFQYQNLFIALGLSCFYVFISYWLLLRVYKHVLYYGKISRFSSD